MGRGRQAQWNQASHPVVESISLRKLTRSGSVHLTSALGPPSSVVNNDTLADSDMFDTGGEVPLDTEDISTY